MKEVELESVEIVSKELVINEKVAPLAVFSEPGGLDPYVSKAREIVAGFEHDLSTDASRKKTAALAHKVAKLKIRLDDMGKGLVSDWKSKAKLVDESRKSMREELDELKIVARAPLTAWEEKEKAALAEKIAAEEKEKQLAEIEAAHELAILMNDKIDLEKADAERLAEAARIAAENERIAREKEQNRIAAEEARAQADAAAQEKIDQADREKKEAEERAEQAERNRIESEARAKVEADIAEKNRVAALEKSARDADAAAEAARLEQIRLADEVKRLQQEETERRERNKQHASKIMGEAKDSLMIIGLDEEKARSVVLAIKAGDIPHIAIHF